MVQNEIWRAFTHIYVYYQLPNQAGKISVRNNTRPCVSQQILQLVFEP